MHELPKLAWPLLIFAISGLVSGCTGPGKETCVKTDWYELGRRQGTLGKTLDESQDYVQSCGWREGDTAWAMFVNGHSAGLVEYCVPENGYWLGRTNGQVRKVCPAQMQGPFLAEYERGQKAYELDRDNENIDRTMASIFEKLAAESLSQGEKTDLRTRLAQLRRSKERNERELSQIERN